MVHIFKAHKLHALTFDLFVAHFLIIIQVVHDVSAEKLFLRDLVAAGAVIDLTGAL